MYNKIDKERFNIMLENDRLKNCFSEIKEIMKKHCKKCKRHKFYHFQLCCTCKYTEILQKISDCEKSIKVEGDLNEK